MERSIAEGIVKSLHSARVAGDLAGMCRLFADHGEFRIAGASADKPISIAAAELRAFRPWLSMLTKVFRVSNYQLLSFIFEGGRGSAHWRADIHSKITGVTVPTEFVDLFDFRSDRIVGYNEFFVPRAD